MSILDPRLWLTVAAGLLIAYGGGRWQQHGADQAKYQAKELAAVQAARTEEQRRTAAQTEIANAATQAAEKARADARAASATSDKLRQRVAQLVASHPATTASSPATDDPIGMLADVFGRADQRAGILAAAADSARIAGQACERAYDALTPVHNQP